MVREGAAQCLVMPTDMCWEADVSAKTVIVMGTEVFDGREHRHVDLPITDLLQMAGAAGRPQDASGQCVVMCHTPKKEFIKRLLQDPIPVESHLDHFLHDHINAEVVTKTIESKQDAVDYITWSFYYRRLTQNPNYYDLQGVTHQHPCREFRQIGAGRVYTQPHTPFRNAADL